MDAMHGHMGGGYFWAMWVGMAVFWATLIVFGVWAVRRLSGGFRGRGALRILEERFARGQIDEQEFHARAATLRGR